MLDLTQDILLLFTSVAAAMIFMFLLNRIWPHQKRSEHNDLIGWQLGILGTTYAVILGFMLYTVWTSYGEANLNVDMEANALRNVYRLSEGLPAPQRDEIKQQARAYAHTVVDKDWPEMADNRLPEESHFINESMWKTLMSIHNASPTELSALDHSVSELSTLTEHRRTRLLQSVTYLPAIFWWVLIIGAIVTILSATLFGAANARLHALQVFSFALLIILVLLAIADVNRPFQGWVHVSDFAFRRAIQNMNN